MRVVARVALWAMLVLLAAIVVAAGWLYLAPPDLIRVGANYSAKIVCSNVFIAGRDPEAVLALDVQAPGHPLLRLMSADVDREGGVVRAGLLGLFGGGLAVHREGTGCAAVPDGDIDAGRATKLPGAPVAPEAGALWPVGDRVEPSQSPEIDALLDDAALAGPGMRAIVIMRNGRILAERYGEGFSEDTPLLGWSMTKTVTAAILGTLVEAGHLRLDRADLFDAWTGARGTITVADMLAMASGLAFNEDYGDVTDVTRMLYLEPDMAAFAAGKPLEAEPGTQFNYSTGTTVMLSRIWQNLFEDGTDALSWPREALFNPLRMGSAVLETDASGTFVGSSYLYATARDWARFAALLLNKGRWEGRRILPEGYVAMMREPSPSSGGEYGRGHVWLHGPRGATPEGTPADAGYDLPPDAFWALGHDGQTIAMVPSLNLAVIRMGLTPSDVGYKPQALLEAVIGVLERGD